MKLAPLQRVIPVFFLLTHSALATSYYWDADKSQKWGSNGSHTKNWVGDNPPPDYANIVFDDSYVSSNQKIQVIGGDKNVGSITFDGKYNYTLYTENDDYVITFDTNGAGTSALNISGTANHAINVNTALANDLKLTQDSNTTFTFGDDLNINDNALSIDTVGTVKIAANLSGKGDLTMNGTGTLELASGASVNVNSIDLSGGSLLLTQDNQVSSGVDLTLSGGTLNLNGNDLSIDSLTLTGNSIIDFGGGDSILNFTDSSSVSWTEGATLTIVNWSGNIGGGGGDQLLFGNSGLTAGQMAQIQFLNPAGESGSYSGAFFGNEVAPDMNPIPEPSAWISGLALTGITAGRRLYRGIRRTKSLNP